MSQNITVERNFQWTKYFESEGVLIEYRYEECNIPDEGYFREYVLIRLTNSNVYPVTVDWDIVRWFGEKCKNCDMSDTEQHRHVLLDASGSVEGTCSLYESKMLKIFSKFLNEDMPDAELSYFQLENIKVNKIK